MENSLPPLKHVARAYAFAALFSTCIALVLWQLEVDSLRNNIIVSLCIGLSICSMYLVFGNVGNGRSVSIVASVLISAIGIGLGLLLAGLLLQSDALFYFRVASSALLLAGFFGAIGSVIALSYLRLIEVQAELTRTAAREAEQAKLATQAQLGLLQAQIEPHFLFNTLSNIHSLIEHRPDDAKKTLENLTTLLRRSLERTREQSITLKEEVDILRAYLDIQKIRMGHRLSYEIDVPAELDSTMLPPLLLQPLVENAVIHGLNSEKGGHVSIQATKQDKALMISVSDNGIGLDRPLGQLKKTENTGIGISNIRERLSTLYGEDANLSYSDYDTDLTKQTGCIATLTLPFQS